MKKLLFAFLAVAILFTGCTKNEKKSNQDDNLKEKVAVSYKNATIQTSYGDIKIELFNEITPKTIENFVKLAKDGFYDKTKVHYLENNRLFMAGDPNTREGNTALWGIGGPGYNLSRELNDQIIQKGSIAALNIGDQSHGSQFIIFLGDNMGQYQGKVTVFGKIISGEKILDEINSLTTDNQQRPVKEIIIEKININ